MDKRAIGIILGLILLAFAFGRYSAPEKIKTQIKTVTVQVEKKQVTHASDQEKTITEILRPDGTKIVRTRTEDRKTTEIKRDSGKANLDETTKEIATRPAITVSAIISTNIAHPLSGFNYGAEISRPILGPISLGVFGSSDGTAGLSVGIDL